MRDFAVLRTSYILSATVPDQLISQLTIRTILHNLLIELDTLNTPIPRNLPIPRRTKVLIIVLLASTSWYRFRTDWHTFTILSNEVEITDTSATSKNETTYHS